LKTNEGDMEGEMSMKSEEGRKESKLSEKKGRKERKGRNVVTNLYREKREKMSEKRRRMVQKTNVNRGGKKTTT
jgi:hypothetical protein